MVHIVVVGDSDPMIFSLDLEPVQLAHKGGDVLFCIISPWCEEVGFDIQLLLGGNNIPHVDLGNHCLDVLGF